LIQALRRAERVRHTTRIVTEELDGAEGHATLARHIANLVAGVVRALPQEDRAAAQTEPTNQIIRLLAANPIEARRNDDLVENPPEQLLAIQPISNLPNDDRDLVAPLVGLSASDLLVNARGEPGLVHALAHEVPSADSIDLLCAFVRWHGSQLLADQLEAHCRAGRRLRVITLLHCLHRLVKSLEVSARGRRGVEREVIAGGIARHPREVRCHTVVVSPHPVSGSIVAT
jgi:hypothetical protein